ncbi:MAG: bifunctional oligoribonuclease/PAP phosphatase NrnA, partial [Opitutaceae bacterium]|nr:bifunctional oligoribonuclease/PAP phosphatase NrnA [Opitutaceae bacterium]
MASYFPAFSARFHQVVMALGTAPIAVVGHARPDGDCIGSQVALARVLGALGKTVVCANPDPVPRRLRFLAPDVAFLSADEIRGEVGAVFVDCA